MRVRYCLKIIQRRTYDILSNRNSLFCFLAFFIVLPTMFLVMFEKVLWFWNSHHAIYLFNSGYGMVIDKTGQLKVCQNEPVDVVYTWVNGSDPEFLKSLIQVKRQYLRKYSLVQNCSLQANCTNNGGSMFFKTPLVAFDSRIDLKGLDFGRKRPIMIQTDFYETSYQLMNLSPDERQSLEKFFQLNHETHDLRSTYIRVDCSNFGPLNDTPNLAESFIPKNIISIFSTSSSLPPRKQILKIFSEKERTHIGELYYHDSRKMALIILETQQTQVETTIVQHLEKMGEKLNFSISSDLKIFIGEQDLYECQDERAEESLSVNRFADNDELKYSMRSMEKFAPWVRNVYLVTNGQIPNWININHPKLRLITHEEIFLNKDDLPTFNSAAIECHLHRIPGLSQKFLYFNDDMMLGKSVSLDDFFSPNHGYHVYFAWPVPNCEPGCPTSWLNDGFCDAICNTTLCLYDGGDCLNGSSTTSNANQHQSRSAPHGANMPNQGFGASAYPRSPRNQCSPSCADFWLGDKYCDNVCNNLLCGFDMGDCGLDNYAKMPGQIYRPNITEYLFPSSNTVYLNLTQLFQSNPQITAASCENHEKLRAITLNTNHKVLTLLLTSNVSDLTINVDLSLKIGVKGSQVSFKLIVTDACDTDEDIGNQSSHTIATIKPKLKEELTESIKVTIATIPDDEIQPKSLINLTPLFSRNSSLFEVLKLDGNLTLDNQSKAFEQLTDKGLLLERYWKILSQTGKNFQSQGNFPWERDGTFEKLGRLIESFEKYESLKVTTRGQVGGRHLLDTFSDSLKYVNHLYNRVFGIKARKVVAHTPYFLDIDVINRLWNRFPDEMTKTSSHKLRSSEDMQFSFTYFNFLTSETVSTDLHQVLSRFDTDQSGSLSANELRSLMVTLTRPPYSRNLWNNYSSCWNASELDQVEQNGLEFSFKNLLECSYLKSSLEEKFSQEPRNRFRILGDSEVSFIMVQANSTQLLNKLDHLRAKPKKFLCFNDDIQKSEEAEVKEVRRLLSNYYQYLVPEPSSFELPAGKLNGFRDVREYRKMQVNNRFKHTKKPVQWIFPGIMLSFLSLIILRMILMMMVKGFRRKGFQALGSSPFKV